MVLYNKQELAVFTTESAKALLAPMLPPGVSYETVLSELYFAIQKNPEIAKCEVPSMLMAVQRCLSWGLTIGETAHLVPFKNKLTAVRDYKGDVALVVRAGGAKSIDAYVVWDDEVFDYGLGDAPFVKHRPALRRKEGAKIIAAYAVAHIGANLPPKIVIMGVDEIEQIRKTKSKSWVTETYWENGTKKQRPYRIEQIPWYCEKTVVHRIVKQLPTAALPAVAQVVAQLDDEIVTDAVIEDAPESGDSVRETSRGSTSGLTPEGAGSHAAGEPRADSDGVVASADDGQIGPKCSVHGAAMVNQATTKTNVKAPDYFCPIEGCKEKFWPGQWPPKPLATDEQRAEIGRLAKEAERVGVAKVTIDAANRKCADPELKAPAAEKYIAQLKERIDVTRKAKAEARGDHNTADSSPDTKDKF